MPFSFPLFLVLLTFVLMSIALGLKFYEWWRRREMSAMLRTAAEGPAPEDPAAARHGRGKRRQLEGWLERLALLKKTQKAHPAGRGEWTPGGLLLLMTGGAVGGMACRLLLPAVFA